MKAIENVSNPLEYVHDILKGKWKTVILWNMRYRKSSTTRQLKKDIKGISMRMLLEQLSELRMYGLVNKRIYENDPMKVEYYLTDDKGKKLLKALEIMEEIGENYVQSFQSDDKQE